MSETIRVVSTRTVVKKITVGTPIPNTVDIRLVTSLDKLLDVDQTEGFLEGDTLVYDAARQLWEPTSLLVKQVIDGGEGF